RKNPDMSTLILVDFSGITPMVPPDPNFHSEFGEHLGEACQVGNSRKFATAHSTFTSLVQAHPALRLRNKAHRSKVAWLDSQAHHRSRRKVWKVKPHIVESTCTGFRWAVIFLVWSLR